jgi:hypothetical protein
LNCVRADAGALLGERQQEAEGVAVGGDRVGTWRWPISRSVKKACIVGASVLIARPSGCARRALVGRVRQRRAGT